jgi:hypothetical protein
MKPKAETEVKADKIALQETIEPNKKLQEENQQLNHDRIIDEKSIRELSREKDELRRKVQDADTLRQASSLWSKSMRPT